MEDSCPATPLVLAGRDSKSPLQVAVSSPESDEMKSPSPDSPDSRCVICLGRLRNKSFTDNCLHQFCFQCLLQWSKVKPECPLCKQPFKSIIHNVRSNVDYDQYHIQHEEPPYVFSDFMHSYNLDLFPVNRRFRYRSTMTREYFRELAESFLAQTRRLSERPYQIPSVASIDPLPAENQRRHNRLHISSMRPRQRGTSDFRTSIYIQDLWVQDLVEFSGRYSECTPQFYRENPAQIFRMIPWLNREVNVLLNECESHAAYVLSRIVSILTQHSIRSREFRELVQPYFGNRTDHFIHEFYTFARSVYDIAGFDQHAVYGTNPNYATEVQEILSSSDDSEIEVLETFKNQERNSKKSSKEGFKKILLKRIGDQEWKLGEPIAGPSGINSSNASESVDTDEIKILDYVKPEPLIVTLSSDEESGFPLNVDLNKRRSETKNEKNGKSLTEYLSPDERISSSEIRNERYRKGKGKCRSNGFGLKGRQKKNYTNLKNGINVSSEKFSCSTTRSGSNSSTDTSSSSSSTSSSSSFCSRSHFYKSRSPSVASSSSSEYKPNKNKKKRSRLFRKKYKKKISDKTCRKILSENKITKSEMDKVPSKKKKVKSCVIVPRSRSRDSSPHPPSRDSAKEKRKKSPRAPASYWSIVSSRTTGEKHRKGGEGSLEMKFAKSKRKRRESSCEETSGKRVRGSASSSERYKDHESSGHRQSEWGPEYSRTSSKNPRTQSFTCVSSSDSSFAERLADEVVPAIPNSSSTSKYSFSPKLHSSGSYINSD